MGTLLQLQPTGNADATPALAQWRQAGYAAIDRMVEDLYKKFQGKDLEQLSDLMREMGKEVTAAVFEKVINTAGEEQLSAQTLVCPECNRTLRSPRQMRRTIDTRHGRIALQRPYFYCKPCHRGSFPFDEKLGISPTYKQYDLQKPAARLMAELPFETASRLFEEITGDKLSDHTMHEMAEDLAEASDLVHVLPTRKKVEEIIERCSLGRTWRPILVVAADGAHVPIRPEAGRSKKRGPGEWREAKGFRIYLVGQERITQIMSWHEIADEQEFGEALQFAATLIPTEKVRVALLGDGAPWLWKHLKKAFPRGKEILDYYHCSEHIHRLAEVHYPLDPDKQVLWIESTMARLNEGDIDSVLRGLRRMAASTDSLGREEIRKLTGYLQEHAHRIDYKAIKRGQYPRGSGGIESANKFICHVRMKRSGAWWYVINGNAMLRLRCSVYNLTFDEVFARYKRIHRSAKNS